ncbi:DUF2849 domain-containing protein [Dongia deserti]|uniref:DUF2849 domain-containing protein n=1 Tax=Dongia deserti TaxID=2268030 RepID=UPI000E65C0E8|nr:DUF2849 domain-containing protein [Dongia deserti]
MAMASQMITANRLLDGAVVYFTAGKSWSPNFTDGAVWPDKESADAALIESKESVKARIVVEPYLFDVAVTEAGPKPTSARERIRADHKPTFEPDQGSWTGQISG